MKTNTHTPGFLRNSISSGLKAAIFLTAISIVPGSDFSGQLPPFVVAADRIPALVAPRYSVQLLDFASLKQMAADSKLTLTFAAGGSAPILRTKIGEVGFDFDWAWQPDIRLVMPAASTVARAAELPAWLVADQPAAQERIAVGAAREVLVQAYNERARSRGTKIVVHFQPAFDAKGHGRHPVVIVVYYPDTTESDADAPPPEVQAPKLEIAPAGDITHPEGEGTSKPPAGERGPARV